MNGLIIVGLLAFALVAILAAVFLALGEQRASQRVATQAAAKPVNEQQVPVPAKEEQAAETKKETLPVLSNSTLPVATDAFQGQFHEFAAQIQALHEEAMAFEQRLSVLVEMIDTIENAQGVHVSIEEELALPMDSAAV